MYGPGDKEMMAFFQIINFHIKPYLGDLKRRLQLVHVDDLCLGIHKAITSQTKSGSIYFIAENRSYTMEDLISLLEKAANKKCFPLILPASIFKAISYISKSLFKLVNATPMLTPEKANELLASWEVSTSKAENELGYVSQIPFADGAKQTYNWYVEQRRLK